MTKLTWIRLWLTFFIVCLIGAGVTAFPLAWELGIASSVLHDWGVAAFAPDLIGWVDRVHAGVVDAYGRYPFIAYGTDWLAYAHLMIAIAFLGPLRDPVRNIWVIDFGLIACACIIPLAFICGPIRGIPFYWILIDCSFGVIGAAPLLLVRRDIRRLERMRA